MRLYLDTVSQDVVIEELDGVLIPHPTVGMELTSLWTPDELYAAESLWQLKRDGLVVIYDEEGNEATQDSTTPPSISDAKERWAAIKFSGGQNLNNTSWLKFNTTPTVNTLLVTFPNNTSISIPNSGWYDIELKLVGYKFARARVWYVVTGYINGNAVNELSASTWVEPYTRTYTESIASARVYLVGGDVLRFKTRRRGQSARVYIRNTLSWLRIKEAKVR